MISSFLFLLMVRHKHTQSVLTSSSPCRSTFVIKLWKQKRRGSMSHLVPIPSFRPSHCPQVRISNVKPAHASDDISIHHGAGHPKGPITLTITLTLTITIKVTDTLTITIHIRKESITIFGIHLIIYNKGKLAAGRYKINPRERFLLHHRCIKIQSCEV